MTIFKVLFGKKNALMSNAEFLILSASLVSQRQRIHLPMQEIQVQSLGQGDLLEEGMAIHSTVLAWITPWTEEPDGLQALVSRSQTPLK